MIFRGGKIPPGVENCRNVWLYSENGKWVISTRSKTIARFAQEADALDWWNKFETTRGFSVKPPKRSKPHTPHRKAATIPQTATAASISQSVRVFLTTTHEHRQALLAKINQGRYDNETNLLRLRKNATDRGEERILNAIHQRLKIVAPETYRKLVGPLHVRDPLGTKKCYCGRPASLSQIASDIMTNSISEESLLCDACWDEDICSAWGHYGAWGAKIIDTYTWTITCKKRGDAKYATY